MGDIRQELEALRPLLAVQMPRGHVLQATDQLTIEAGPLLELVARLAECERERDEAKAYADKLVESVPGLPKDLEVLRIGNTNLANENAALLAENRLLREALNWCHETYGSSEWSLAAPDDMVPLTAAEVERVKRLEKVAEAAKELTVCAAWELDGAWDALCAALAALETTTKEEK